MSDTGSDRVAERFIPLVGLLFFLSGAASLTYQLVWVRLLVLTFGSTTLAVSTVLSAFMTGLALGSVLCGRWVDRRGEGLKLYAGLELLIAVAALLLLPLLALTDDLYTAAHGLLDGNRLPLALARAALSFLVLLLPATLIGGTLPALSKFVSRRLSIVGRTVGTLHALNTLGAAAGCVGVAFLLLEGLGIRGTIFATAGVNVCIALAALGVHVAIGRSDEPSTMPDPHPAIESSPPEPALSNGLLRAVFWGYGLSGFAALGYEVLWTRLLAVALRSTTTQSLSTILIVFLTGLAVGGAVASRFVDRSRNLPALFGLTEVLLGLSALASVAVFGAIPQIVEMIGPAYSWWAHLAKQVAVASAGMFVPTFLMGVLFPVAGRIQVRALSTLGRSIGGIYAINTTGAIFGALVAGFVLLPLLGTQWSIQLLAWLNIAVGVAVLLLDSSRRSRVRSVVTAFAVVSALALTFAFPSTHLIGLFRPDASTLLYYDESASGTVTVLEHENGQRLLRVNGAGEVPTDLASIQTFRMLGSLPLLIHPDPEEVLVIAFGGGVTLSTVELLQPRHIDCVEIVPGVVDAAPYFAEYNHGVHERIGAGRIDVIGDDGRSYVLRTSTIYDVIVSDSTHPGTADSWVLYTRDFYELCRRRLSEAGVFAQWVPLHGLTAADYRMIVRTFRSAFPHTSIWLTPEYSVLVGTSGPLRIDFDLLRSRMEAPRVRESLEAVDLGDPVSLLGTLALDEQAVAAYAGEGPINTDDRAYINFRDRLRAGTQSGVQVLYSLTPRLSFRPERFVRGTLEQLRAVDRRRRSRMHMFLAMVALKTGNRGPALKELEQARRYDPTNREVDRILEAMGVDRRP